jgi:hypothetical protein
MTSDGRGQVSKASLFALPSQWVPEPPPDGGNEALLTVSKGGVLLCGGVTKDSLTGTCRDGCVDVTQPAFSYKYVLAVTVPGSACRAWCVCDGWPLQILGCSPVVPSGI